MRESYKQVVISSENDDLLTTGEAARFLGVSRQHVADMCDRGDLPFVTVGTHRRIRRADLQLAQARTQRLTRDQLRTLWLGHAIAGRLVSDPDGTLSTARDNLKTHKASQRSKRWIEEWMILVSGPIEKILVALTSPSPKNRELRQNSPFAGVLSEGEREDVLASFVKAHPGRSNETF